MGDISQTISLSAVGADETATAIRKTGQALDQITTSSSQMESQFSHRFSHIGLQLFATDLLRTSGLGTEARQIIGTLQMGIMSAGSAFGAAAGPIMLVGGALVAVGGIIVKVIEHHKEEAEAIQKLIDQQTKSKAGYDKEIEALHAMQIAGVALTGAQAALLKADQAVSQDLQSNLLVNQAKEIEALEKQRSGIAAQQALHTAWTASMNAAKQGLIEIASVIGNMVVPGITAFASGVQGLIGHLQSMLTGVGQHVTLTGKFKQSYDELTAAIAKMRVQHAQTTAGVTSDINQMSQAAIKYRQQRISNELAMYREMQEIRSTDAAQQRQTMENRLSAWIENKQQEVAEEQKTADEETKIVKRVSDQMGKDIGQAFAQMIVEGRNFSDSMNQAMTHMAEQFIQDVIAMIVEWLALRAVMSIIPGGAAAYSAGAQAAYPAVSQAAYSSMGNNFHAAEGGQMMVDKPTLFLAGEAGPEMATFTPIAKGGGSGGGGIGTVNIVLNVDHIEGDNPGKTLDLLSQEIRRQTVAGRIFATTVTGVSSQYPNQAF